MNTFSAGTFRPHPAWQIHCIVCGPNNLSKSPTGATPICVGSVKANANRKKRRKKRLLDSGTGALRKPEYSGCCGLGESSIESD